jgi:hypothetical protein
MTVKTVHKETARPSEMLVNFPVDEPATQIRLREAAGLQNCKGEVP